MKIVVNRCYGGFGLSEAAWEEYLNRSGKPWYKWDGRFSSPIYSHAPQEEYEESKHFISYYGLERNDPLLIQIVEEMGTEADGDYACLEVVEIPDDVDWYIVEYDGNEHIAERHRTW